MRKLTTIQWVFLLSMLSLAALTLVVAGFGCGKQANAAEHANQPVPVMAANSFSPALPREVSDPVAYMLKADDNAVTVRCLVDTNGHVERVLDSTVAKALKPLFDQVARTWKFTPAELNCRRVRSIVVVTFNYRVQKLGQPTFTSTPAP